MDTLLKGIVGHSIAHVGRTTFDIFNRGLRMPHNYLEGLDCEWSLIRETSASSKFIAINEGAKCAVDIHYTSSKSVTVNLMVEGTDDLLDKGFLNPLMNDIEQIALKHNDYAVIDYSMGACNRIYDGNYSVDEKKRKFMRRGS